MMRNLKELVRPNVAQMKPYSSARDEYSGQEAQVFLDANECPYNRPLNRYPDPMQQELKERLATLKGVRPECLFLGNGSDEAIDLLYRVFCRPGKDNVVAIAPTYGMYEVCAAMNDVEYRPVMLNARYQMSAEALLRRCDHHTKLVWLCSPNNPTGNLMDEEQVRQLLHHFTGIVVVDEAYGDFTRAPQWRQRLSQWPNLVVLNTMSKAWGCAAIRLGMALASPEIVALMNKVKYPYNVNLLTQQAALEALEQRHDVQEWVNELVRERELVMEAVRQLPYVKAVYPSEANFFLVRMKRADDAYHYLVQRGIIVRSRTKVKLCEDCLRITIGSRTENQTLLAALRQWEGTTSKT